MDTRKHFTIQFRGLSIGVHQFDYQINQSFFAEFEDSSITDSNIGVVVEFDRRVSMIVLNVSLKGTIKSECDRCMEAIDLPIEGQQQLMVKYSEEDKEEEDDVFYINPLASSFNIAKYVYELAHLSIPLRKLKPLCLETPEACEFNILDYFEDGEMPNEDAEAEEKGIEQNSIWSELAKLNVKGGDPLDQ